MKVTGPNSLGSAQSNRASPKVGGAFSLGRAGQARDAAPAATLAGPAPVSSLDALIALQAIGGPLERRRRAVSRAGRILDVLEDVKLALLEGEVSPAALSRLVGAVREERESTDDAGLDNVLNEIETRAAVELAKLGLAA